MEFKDLIKERYSCRKFNDTKIDKDVLLEILEAGRIAPTAKNLQPIRIYVFESDESINKIDQVTPCRYGARTVIGFTYNKDEQWRNSLEEGIRSGVQDVSIVATHIMLMAKNLGVDSCWINFFTNSKLEELFNIPKNEKSVLLLALGYAHEDAEVSPKHTEKKNLDQIVKFL